MREFWQFYEPRWRTIAAETVADATRYPAWATAFTATPPEELDRRITEEAARIGEDAGELGKRLRKSDGLQALEIQMVREKALDFLTSSANISSAE